MNATDSVKLSYFLWLPAGKDEFGFEHFEDAPMSDTAFYRTTLERTISSHFKDTVTALTDDLTGLANMSPNESMKPIDGELALRKIHFGFKYRWQHHALERWVRHEPFNGTAIFYSNGLYLWSFDIPLKKRKAEHDPGEWQELKSVLVDFLRYDFVGLHIAKLFQFGWNPGTVSGSPDSYRGILTYYQLDLLFNGVFDQSSHPHLSLGDGWQDRNGEDIIGKVKQKYAMRYLIESLSLCAVDREYLPLFDKRKSYSLRRTHGDENAYVDSEVSLNERRLLAGDERELNDRETFIGRISFAAMEQFLRVAISFGLTYYKTGLDHIRAELISQGMQTRKNSSSEELRRPSLRSRSLTLADLETYHSLLAGKLPVLTFLNELVEGLSEVTAPVKAIKIENGDHGGVEFRYAQETLAEARKQFGRMINAIRTDVAAIDSSLNAARTDLMILELTETRKLSEISAESPREEVEIAGQVKIQADANFAVLFGLAGVFIGVMEILSNVGVWLTGQALGQSFSPPKGLVWIYWSALATIIFAALLVLGVVWLWQRRQRSERENRHRGRLEQHIFDYSSLLRNVEAEGGRSALVMHKLRENMVDIENPRTTDRCTSFQTYHETPSSGVERIKYTLESKMSKQKLSYMLHVEFDRRLSGRRIERLLDIRLVVSKPVTVAGDFVEANSHLVIANCVKQLLFPSGSDAELKEFCLARFGWDPSPSPGTTQP